VSSGDDPRPMIFWLFLVPLMAVGLGWSIYLAFGR
jgi:hypothetical protein